MTTLCNVSLVWLCREESASVYIHHNPPASVLITSYLPWPCRWAAAAQWPTPCPAAGASSPVWSSRRWLRPAHARRCIRKTSCCRSPANDPLLSGWGSPGAWCPWRSVWSALSLPPCCRRRRQSFRRGPMEGRWQMKGGEVEEETGRRRWRRRGHRRRAKTGAGAERSMVPENIETEEVKAHIPSQIPPAQ